LTPADGKQFACANSIDMLHPCNGGCRIIISRWDANAAVLTAANKSLNHIEQFNQQKT